MHWCSTGPTARRSRPASVEESEFEFEFYRIETSEETLQSIADSMHYNTSRLLELNADRFSSLGGGGVRHRATLTTPLPAGASVMLPLNPGVWPSRAVRG